MEILSHASLFLIFLTLFYVTYVGFIQGISMKDEFVSISNGIVNALGLLLPSGVLKLISGLLKGAEPDINKTMQGMETNTENENRRVMKPVIISVLVVSIVCFLLACIIARYIGYSVTELCLENLVALSIIGVTDIVITTVYGTFRLLDLQYIQSLIGLRATGAGSNINCNVVEITLDNMFPIGFIKSIIKFLLNYEPS